METPSKVVDTKPHKAVLALSSRDGGKAGRSRQASQLDRARFLGYYYQLEGVVTLPRSRVGTILEIGPRDGLFAAWLRQFDFRVATLDADLSSGPDVLGSALALPIAPRSVGMVCAFDVLHDLPYEDFLKAVREMASTAAHYVYISVPGPPNSLRLNVELALRERLQRFSLRFRAFKTLPGGRAATGGRRMAGEQDGSRPPAWAIDRGPYPRRRVIADLQAAGLSVSRHFRNPWRPRQHFMLCEVG